MQSNKITFELWLSSFRALDMQHNNLFVAHAICTLLLTITLIVFLFWIPNNCALWQKKASSRRREKEVNKIGEEKKEVSLKHRNTQTTMKIHEQNNFSFASANFEAPPKKKQQTRNCVVGDSQIFFVLTTLFRFSKVFTIFTSRKATWEFYSSFIFSLFSSCSAEMK